MGVLINIHVRSRGFHPGSSEQNGNRARRAGARIARPRAEAATAAAHVRLIGGRRPRLLARAPRRAADRPGHHGNADERGAHRGARLRYAHAPHVQPYPCPLQPHPAFSPWCPKARARSASTSRCPSCCRRRGGTTSTRTRCLRWRRCRRCAATRRRAPRCSRTLSTAHCARRLPQ